MDPQQVYQAPGSKHHFVNNVELIVFYIIVTLSLYFLIFLCSVNVSLSILVKLVAKLVTHAGNSTAWSMASSPMVKCPPTS